MFYPFVLLLLLLSVSSSSAYAVESPLPSLQESSISQEVMNLRTVLSKLSETLKTTQELDTLKSLGMPEREAERLKEALNMKVKQLTEDAIYVIRTI